MRLFKRKDSELFDIARFGADAATVKRVLGDILSEESTRLVRSLANSKPDLGEYAFLAGQVHILERLSRSLDLNAAEGKDAVAQLQRR